ncbi:MAG: glycine cleavage system aminomethyltransferase GcvT [Bacillota bacterium]|jgi:aminomethyltransferase
MDGQNLKKTALYDEHIALGGKIVDFGGWALPVQFSGILQEHLTVRQAAGLFDVSHMGEITIEGPDAESYLQHVATNNIANAEDWQIIYSPLCYENGNVVDDVLIYRYNRQKYLLVINASNIEKDWQWLNQQKKFFAVQLDNISGKISQMALQGPRAQKILTKVCNGALSDLRFYRFYDEVEICGQQAIVSRSGYTGEDGFEIYMSNSDAVDIWRGLLAVGYEDGLIPCGLGARDTLRLEAALPLYGHEISEHISPLEAGLGMFVKLDKGDFIGKATLAEAKARGLKRKSIGFEVIGRGIARENYLIEKNGHQIGFVTSGSFAPSLGKNIGMALIDARYANVGEEIDIIVRQRPVPAVIIAKPFLEKKYKK